MMGLLRSCRNGIGRSKQNKGGEKLNHDLGGSPNDAQDLTKLNLIVAEPSLLNMIVDGTRFFGDCRSSPFDELGGEIATQV
jgi:hypothetical protein